MKKPISAILSSLIVIAEQTIIRPQSALCSGHPYDRIAELGAEVREAHARITEGEPTTAAAMVMITTLEQFLIHRGEGLGAAWLSIAGATLPLLRVETFKAFSNEKLARATP